MVCKKKRLTVERERRGLLKTELARLTGAVDPAVRPMNAATIGQIENGYIRPAPGSSQTKRLALALGYQGDPEELLEDVADNASR